MKRLLTLWRARRYFIMRFKESIARRLIIFAANRGRKFIVTTRSQWTVLSPELEGTGYRNTLFLPQGKHVFKLVWTTTPKLPDERFPWLVDVSTGYGMSIASWLSQMDKENGALQITVRLHRSSDQEHCEPPDLEDLPIAHARYIGNGVYAVESCPHMCHTSHRHTHTNPRDISPVLSGCNRGFYRLVTTS